MKMRKKLVVLMLAGTMAFSMVACGESSDQTEEAQTEEATTTETGQNADETAEPVVEHFEVDLSAGNYVAGVDIPAGTYNLTATSGSGNVSSSNMYSGGLNEIMGSPADEYTQETFNNLIECAENSKNPEKTISILRRRKTGLLDTAEGLGMPFVANKNQLINYLKNENDNLNPILRKMFKDGFTFYGIKEKNELELLNINHYDDYKKVLDSF